MSDPSNWQQLEMGALNQGISFLYGQAAELLKRWRDRKEAGRPGTTLSAAPADGVDQSVLVGELQPHPIDSSAVSEHLDEMILLTEKLGSYVIGIRSIDPSDIELTSSVEALRGLLELAYRQQITFQGEQRATTGSDIDVEIVAERVAGELTLARIKTIKSAAQLHVRGEVDTIAKSGRVVGLDVDSIGG
jgi:hypothetical protein